MPNINIEQIQKYITSWLKQLPHKEEDFDKLNKLIKSYGRKRLVSGGRDKTVAAALLTPS